VLRAISQFRVRNGMEEDVRRAFANRPGLVESADGFLGIEVYRGADDPSIFYLVTDWETREHYEAWHGSDAHKESHAGIPAGLKLDSDFTSVTVMERFHPPIDGETAPWVERTRRALAEFVDSGSDVHVLLLDRKGRVRRANRAAMEWIGRDPLEGRSLLDLLVEHDKGAFESILEVDGQVTAKLPLSLVDSADRPYTIQACVRVEPGQVVLVGSAETRDLRALQEQLVDLNNEISVIARENERRRRKLQRTTDQLESTLSDLNESYWHLKKIQEVLPICMSCTRVKGRDSEWQDVVDYLKENSLFLSHGFCPDCAAAELAGLDEPSRGGDRG